MARHPDSGLSYHFRCILSYVMSETPASFFDPSTPLAINVDDYPTLTKASIAGATPGWIEAAKDKGYGEAAFLYRQALMGGLTGVRESNLVDLLLSRTKGKNSGIHLTQQSIGQSKSFFMPYILREKEDIINAYAFTIVAGQVNPNAGTTVDGITYHDGSWEVTVGNSDGLEFGEQGHAAKYKSEIKEIQRFFLKGEHVLVLNLSSGGAAQNPFFVIENAVRVDENSCKVYIRPLVTETEWGTWSNGEKAVYQPTAGVVQIGANSVSDYESWCQNQPVDMSRKLEAYWFQTSRFTRTWDDEYEKYLKYILEGKVNVYLEKFKHLPSTEQNKRMYQLYLRKWMTSVFWGQPINENQTVENYQSLPQVTDPRTGTFLHYKANAVGLYPQLAAKNRVIDNAGEKLNFNVIEEQLYALKRYREGRTGGTVEDIDVMTDRYTANRIHSLMGQYYQKKYGVTWQQHFGPNDPIKAGENRTLWYRRSYELDEIGCVLHVIQEPWMSDFRSHFPAEIRNRANFMWFIDWSDFTLGVAETAKRRSKTPDLETDPDFKCVIKANYTHYDMESTTWTAMIGDESSHLIYTNFSSDCPIYTTQVCPAFSSETSESTSAQT